MHRYRPIQTESLTTTEVLAQVWRWISYIAWSFFVLGAIYYFFNKEVTPYLWGGAAGGIGAYYLATFLDRYAFMRLQGSFLMRMLITFGFLALQYFGWKEYFFFRDPDRTISERAAIVAPADGWIAYIRPIQKDRVPIAIKHGQSIALEEILRWGTPMSLSDGMIIGISMTPMSVHVNRSPIQGKIVHRAYYPGRSMHSMFPMWMRTILGTPPYEDESFHIVTNERETLLIDGDFPVFVTRIADVWINKIELWKKDGDKVAKGERIGLIKMGSQTDIVFPTIVPKGRLKIEVEEGDYVYAGETAIATYQ